MIQVELRPPHLVQHARNRIQLGIVRRGQMCAPQHGLDWRVPVRADVGQGVPQPSMAAATHQHDALGGLEHEGHVIGIRIGHLAPISQHQMVRAGATRIGSRLDRAGQKDALQQLGRLFVQVKLACRLQCLSRKAQPNALSTPGTAGIARFEPCGMHVHGDARTLIEEPGQPTRVVVMSVAEGNGINRGRVHTQAAQIVLQHLAAAARIP